MYRTDFWALWEKARRDVLGEALKQVHYQGWNRSPAQVGCMRQVLGPGALGRPRGIGWGGRWEGGSGWGTHINPWLIPVNVWQKPLQYCKVISLQLIKIKGKKKNTQQGGIKIGGRNLNNLRYAYNNTQMAGSEEKLKSFLMRVKEESERDGLKLNIKKLRSWHLAPLLHGK